MSEEAFMPEWLTVGDAAKEAGVSADTIRWWMRTGKLAFESTRGGWRLIDGAVLRKCLETRAAAKVLKERSYAEARLRKALTRTAMMRPFCEYVGDTTGDNDLDMQAIRDKWQ